MKKMRLPKPAATRVVNNRLTLSSVYTGEQMHRFAEKAVLLEREAIAQMIEDAPKLVKFATNDKGGCLVCGFTPKLAAAAIRARGN